VKPEWPLHSRMRKSFHSIFLKLSDWILYKAWEFAPTCPSPTPALCDSCSCDRAILVARSLEEQNTIPRADELVRLSLMKQVTVFCTDRFLSRVTLRFVEKTNDEYCADQKIFSWKLRAPIEADGGNSRQIRRLGVCCFPDRLWMLFWTSPRSKLILPVLVS
jgi:hypothetical protein